MGVWKRHGLCDYEKVRQECDALLKKNGVLGMLPDGTYLCDVVRIDKTHTGYDITIKHGAHIFSQFMGSRIYADLQWATNFPRPQGGQCVFIIHKGKIDGVGKHE